MVTKKSASSKKSSAVKKSVKKISSKKVASKKTTKANPVKRPVAKKLKLETISLQAIPEDATDQFPETGDCMCRQKKKNGKFFSFKLIQGRWVQSSVIPFPTKELCEENCC